MNRTRRIQKHYEHRIDPDRAGYEVLDWSSAASQEARFAVLTRNVPLNGLSLLDVGCGLGDLWAYLRRMGIDTQYTGVDIIEKMVQAARARRPKGHFVVGDIFQASPFSPESFDVVYCSGAFNLNLGNNLEFLPRAVGKMCELARGTVVFNLLHHRAAAELDTYFHYDPRQVKAMLTCPRCRIRILEDYLPNDFTVICEKPAPDCRCGA